MHDSPGFWQQYKHLIASFLILIICIVVVELFYSAVVTPKALEAMAAQGAEAARNPFVIIKDLEQQICITTLLWCVYLILAKVPPLFNERHLCKHDLITMTGSYDSDNKTLNLNGLLEKLETSEFSGSATITTWINCIQRYQITDHNVQNAAEAIESSSDSLGARLEADNALIRYLIWVIPSIGFVGTVRGIGQALAQADKALAGDIAGMVNSLGVAFNSTLIALVISVILMLLLNLLEWFQDKTVVDTRQHCEHYLLKRLQASHEQATQS